MFYFDIVIKNLITWSTNSLPLSLAMDLNTVSKLFSKLLAILSSSIHTASLLRWVGIFARWCFRVSFSSSVNSMGEDFFADYGIYLSILEFGTIVDSFGEFFYACSKDSFVLVVSVCLNFSLYFQLQINVSDL